MSQVITTIANTEAATEPFDVTDYPSCLAMWDIHEEDQAGIDTDTSLLTDIAGGVIGSWTTAGEGYLTIANGTAVRAGGTGTQGSLFPGSPTLPSIPITKDFVALAVADWGAAQILTFGDAAQSRITMNNIAAAANVVEDVDNNTDIFTTGVFTTSTQTAVIYSDRNDVLGGGADFIATHVTATALTELEGLPIANADNAIDLSQGVGSFLMGNNITVYLVCLFAFDTIPSDIDSAIAWMNADARDAAAAGRQKRIWPNWKGLT